MYFKLYKYKYTYYCYLLLLFSTTLKELFYILRYLIYDGVFFDEDPIDITSSIFAA